MNIGKRESSFYFVLTALERIDEGVSMLAHDSLGDLTPSEYLMANNPLENSNLAWN